MDLKSIYEIEYSDENTYIIWEIDNDTRVKIYPKEI